MDQTTIPHDIWEKCSRTAEQLMRDLFAHNGNNDVNYRTALNNEQEKPVFRNAICNTFYRLYESANSILTYTPSDLITGDKDPGWQDFGKLLKEEQDSVTRRMPSAKAKWIADNERNHCQLPGCGRAFGVFTRKHHCRLCGEIFCDEHSRREMPVERPLTQAGREPGGVRRNVRVCDSCYESFNSQKISLSLQEDKDADHVYRQLQDRPLEVRPYAVITNELPIICRIQFVVSTGGGMVLFNRLTSSFQSYFFRHPDRKNAFHAYKVFSETFGKGRADGTVIYLRKSSGHQDVREWWDSALAGNKELAGCLETKSIAYGLHNMGNGLWSCDVPIATDQDRELGSYSTSAGELIGNIVGVSFWLAAKEREQLRARQRRRCILADDDLGRFIRQRQDNYRPNLLREAEGQMAGLIERLHPAAFGPMPR